MKKILAFVCVAMMLVSCGENIQKRTEKDLKARVDMLKTAAPGTGAAVLANQIETQLLSGSNTYGLSKEEVASMQHLYAYMSIADMGEFDFDYYVNLTRGAYRTKDLPWGDQVTPELFKFYVLPARVNNETLDNGRDVFYAELYPRVKDLSMYDAAIEVNHWCREKIVYEPTDGRTTQPTVTAMRGYGRCGEESTVAVTALRSVGIPARQVYVPRWAHTNSNHAWVECWVDGEWYYLGACEPEPYLNRGWFTASASRAMLVNSYSYGPLTPQEQGEIKGELLGSDALFTEVSSTATYTEVKPAVVQVLDANGKGIEGVRISYGIINGNSLGPLTTKYTNKKGISSFTTALGSFIIEAYVNKDGKELYAAREMHVKDVDTLVINLVRDERYGNEDGSIAVADFAVTPPPETRFPKALTDEEAAAHNARCEADDAIRYAKTSAFRFTTQEAADAFAAQMVKKGLPRTKEKQLANILAGSRAGGYEVEKFLNATPAKDLSLAVDLLAQISAKDINEITAETYNDYFYGVTRLGNVYQDTRDFQQYVLRPRLSNEIPIAYKGHLWDKLVECGMTEPGPTEGTLAAISKALDEVTVVSTAENNPRNFNMTPIAVCDFGAADSQNFNVYARALFAVAGIPARAGQGGMQYLASNGRWETLPVKGMSSNAVAQAAPAASAGKGKLNISDPEGAANGRRYTLQRWNGTGYGSAGGAGMMGGMGGGRGAAPAAASNEYEAGLYRIMTTVRSADGSMLTRTMTFELKPGEEKTIVAEWYPKSDDDVLVIGSMDAEWRYTAKGMDPNDPPTSILNTVGRNFFVLAYLECTKEPSQHFIREFSSVSDRIEMPMLFMFKDQYNMDFFFKQNYVLNPKINYGFDSQDNAILKGLSNSLKATDLAARMPVVVVADSFGNIYYSSIGYNIGVPEAITKLNLPVHVQ